MAKKKSKTVSTESRKTTTSIIIKATHKTKEDNIHEINNNINRGVGVVTSKKKQTQNFRKEKHKKNTRDFM